MNENEPGVRRMRNSRSEGPPMTCAEAIAGIDAKLDRFPDTTGWVARHRFAWAHPGPIVLGIQAAAAYADAHAARFESPIGEDGVLGPAFTDILRGLRTLLNGETGALDCGTLDAMILRIAEIAGVDEDAL